MSYFPKPSLNENDLAIIERGNTAAHSIEAGKYVSWKGRTGKAKAAILQGATLSDSLFDYDEDGALNALEDSLTPELLLTCPCQPNNPPANAIPDVTNYRYLLVLIYNTSNESMSIVIPTTLISVHKVWFVRMYLNTMYYTSVKFEFITSTSVKAERYQTEGWTTINCKIYGIA